MDKRLNPEEIMEGQELVPLKKTMTQEKINTYISSAEDYNPIHVDPEFAKKTPFKSTIAPGYQFIAYISELMTRDFGEKWITGGMMDVRLLRAVLPGDELSIGGKVTEKREEENGIVIGCDVWIKNHRDEDVIVGNSLVNC
ncbi:MAG: MaoC family dehydratase [Thermodesulfobacteriota bacterium]|nr:MaoC family dehydratase [Thermodesulfobacteriota bacterium]